MKVIRCSILMFNYDGEHFRLSPLVGKDQLQQEGQKVEFFYRKQLP